MFVGDLQNTEGVSLGKAQGSASLWETSKVFNLSEPQFPDP